MGIIHFVSALPTTPTTKFLDSSDPKFLANYPAKDNVLETAALRESLSLERALDLSHLAFSVRKWQYHDLKSKSCPGPGEWSTFYPRQEPLRSLPLPALPFSFL